MYVNTEYSFLSTQELVSAARNGAARDEFYTQRSDLFDGTKDPIMTLVRETLIWCTAKF